jgi:hypothetical protein
MRLLASGTGPASALALTLVNAGGHRNGRDVFRGTREQYLVRVLFLLRHCGTTPGPAAPSGALSEMRSQLRLQALDFWLRNPDYLADELLNDDERGQNPESVDAARAILDAREPEIRRLPMTKYLFGAYEPLDDVLAPLVTYGLVQHSAAAGQARVREHDYWFMEAGEEFVRELLASAPEVFGWYEERAKLIARVAGTDGGGALKQRQYQQEEYAGTPNTRLIEPITERVRERLAQLVGEEAA